MELTLLPHDHGDARRAALLRRQLMLGGDFGAAAELFRLLDDSSRLRIFWLLCHMEECVVNISAVTGMSSPAVSHHLRLLKDAGLVRSRREGKGDLLPAARRGGGGEGPVGLQRRAGGDRAPHARRASAAP